MTNSLRERRKQQLHDEILDAARALLDEKGHAAMAMDDVAARAGISKPTLYTYFSTKDDLVSATIVRELERLLAMTEPGELAGTPLQRLTRILETVVQLQLNERRQPIRPWVPELRKLSCDHPELMQAIRSLDSRLTTLIREAIDQDEIDPSLDPPTVLRAFYALVSAIRFLPHSSIGEPNPATAVASLAKIFSRGVRSG